jgi:hypothetical protein
MPRDDLKAELTSLAEHATTDPRTGVVLRSQEDHIREDLELFSAGILDIRSMLAGYRKHPHPVEVAVRDPKGTLTQLRRQHNTQTDQGRNVIERPALFADIAANAAFATITGAATATSATSLTSSGAAFPTSGGASGSLAGHIVWAVNGSTGLVYGVIMSNTATVLTVDQWYNPTSTSGAAGTTPGSTALYAVTNGTAGTAWVGLSSNTAHTPVAADVLRTSDGLYADGTGSGTASEFTANGLARGLVLPTFPSTHTTQVQNTWTLSAAVSSTIGTVVAVNSKAAAGSLLNLATLLSATATLNAIGDSVQVTWTITD